MTAFGRVVVLRNVVALGVFVVFGRVLFWPCVVVIVDGGCGGCGGCFVFVGGGKDYFVSFAGCGW